MLEITRIAKDAPKPLYLLCLADPSEEAISDYLKRGDCYVGQVNGEIVSVSVLLPTRPFTLELVNLAVDEKYQGKGYGKRMIEHAIRTAKEGNYKVMELGTGNSSITQLALYQKCGFTIIGVDFDFFRKHYAEPIFENGIECRHQIRLSIDL